MENAGIIIRQYTVFLLISYFTKITQVLENFYASIEFLLLCILSFLMQKQNTFWQVNQQICLLTRVVK